MRLLWLILLFPIFGAGQILVKRNAHLMGGKFEVSIVAPDSTEANRHIDDIIAEISRIEYLISDWKPETQISEVNRNAGVKPVKVDTEVFDLTRRAIRLSEITDGAFDISFAAMEKIWKFDGSMTEVPSPDAVRRSVEKVGYMNIELDSIDQTIFLKRPGMKIGFGALGEGYAVDRCRKMMQERGVKAGLINATGDMTAWGKRPVGRKSEPWNVGIAHPFKRGKVARKFSLDGSVATSGNYEKFVEIEGKRYSHIINPKTGYPATGLTSVTVKGPSAEVANGLSTSIMVLGVKEGLKLLERFPEYGCYMITDEGKSRKRNFRK